MSAKPIKPKKVSGKTVNKQLVVKALTDTSFRNMLEKDPKKALGKAKLTEKQALEVKLVLTAVKGIERQISSLADELLCANGGPCGIA
jgi:hypothetical protein